MLGVRSCLVPAAVMLASFNFGCPGTTGFDAVQDVDVAVTSSNDNEPVPSARVVFGQAFVLRECEDTLEVPESQLEGIGMTDTNGVASFSINAPTICAALDLFCGAGEEQVIGKPYCVRVEGSLGTEFFRVVVEPGQPVVGETYVLEVLSVGAPKSGQR